MKWRDFNIGLRAEVEGDNFKRMWKLISLSYYELPYYLKTSLLFLSNFPEDHLLKKSKIIRLWMAEGYVDVKQNKIIEDVATGYLYELCNRSLIQVAGISSDGRPNMFRIHDVVREYIILKAREHGMVARKSQDRVPLVAKVRCLTLDDSFAHDIEQMSSIKYLLTLLFFSSSDLEWESRLYKVRGDCKMLKVLYLIGATMDTIPKELFRLYHLKYLSLQNTKVSLIPKSIENLEKLETLDLKKTKVIELPIEVLKLRRLQFFLLYNYITHVGVDHMQFDYMKSFKAPYELGQLVNLQKLCYIDANVNIERFSTKVKEVGKLIELRGLGIVNVQ